MLKVKFIFIIFLLSCGLKGITQNSTFISQGKIEFERKTNLHDQMKDWDWDDGSWSDVMKKAIPRFKISYYDLSFSGNITFFKPGKENPDNDKIPGWFGDIPGESNTIYTNLEDDQTTSQKKIYEMTYLLQDSTRNIKWKITDETRSIAGFQCRRANAIIMDSIYVVAFYTDEILTRGGPESFSGLPGMILGLALPHQHITWFATRVEAIPVGANSLVMPTKGKKVTNTTMKENLNEAMKSWGKNGRRMLLYAMI